MMTGIGKGVTFTSEDGHRGAQAFPILGGFRVVLTYGGILSKQAEFSSTNEALEMARAWAYRGSIGDLERRQETA